MKDHTYTTKALDCLHFLMTQSWLCFVSDDWKGLSHFKFSTSLCLTVPIK